MAGICCSAQQESHAGEHPIVVSPKPRRPVPRVALWLLLALATQLASYAAAQGVPAAAQASLKRTAVMIGVHAPRSGFGDQPLLVCGTGTVLEGGDRIVTNMHVGGNDALRKAGGGARADVRMWVWGEGDRPVEVSIMKRESRLQDICAFDVRSFPGDDTSWGDAGYVRFDDLEEGARLYSLGYRHCQKWTWGTGVLRQKLERQGADLREFVALDRLHGELPEIEGVWWHDYSKLYLASPDLTDGGNSGGPIVDEHGRLVGIAFAGGPSVSVIIPGEFIYKAANKAEPETTSTRRDAAAVDAPGVVPSAAAWPTPVPLPPQSPEQVARAKADVEAMRLAPALTFRFLGAGQLPEKAGVANRPIDWSKLAEIATGGRRDRRPSIIRIEGDLDLREVSRLRFEDGGTDEITEFVPAELVASRNWAEAPPTAVVIGDAGLIVVSLRGDASAADCNLRLRLKARGELLLKAGHGAP